MSRAWDKEKVQSAHEESNVTPPDYALRFPAGTHNFFRVPRSWQDEKTSFSIYLPSSKLYIPPILFTNVICNCLKVPHFQVFLNPFFAEFFFSFWSILLLFWSTAIFLLVRSFCCINWVDKVSRPFQALAFSSFGLLSEQMTKGSKRQLKKLLMGANHLINSNHHVVILPHRYSTTVSLETYPLFCILCFWCYLIIVLYHTTIFYSGTKRMTMEKILLG